MSRYGWYLADENRIAAEAAEGKRLPALKRVQRLGSDLIDFIPDSAQDNGFLNWLELDTITPAWGVAV